MFKQGFTILMEQFGEPLIVIRGFGTDNPISKTYEGMKNNEKNNRNKIMFQFPEVVDVQVGDVIQQKGSRDLWEVYELEDIIIGGDFVNLNAWVHKKEGMIGRQQTARPAIDLHIGDRYTAEQAGAMGPKAQAQQVSLTQVNANQFQNIDMKVLATELASLRRSMRQVAEQPEHDIAVGEIAAAEQAANANDKEGVLRHLRNAGKWGLDVATKIGVNVASELIKRSM